MPLELEFTIDRTDLILQEDASCRLRMRNAGDKPLSVARPDQTRLIPLLRIVEEQTGVERIVRRDTPATDQGVEGILAPGSAIEGFLSLLDLAHFHVPGVYAVSAIVPYNAGLDRAESAPTTITIKPTTVFGLALGEVHRGSIFAAWMNTAVDPPEVVRTECIPNPMSRSVRSARVAKASAPARPVISANFNRTPGLTHWTAWVQGTRLEFAHFDQTLGGSPTRRLTLPSAEAQIVPPLSIDPPAGADRPGGAALLWSGDGAAGHFVIAELTPASGRLGNRLPMPGSRPRWMHSQFRSDRSRVVLFARGEGDAATLHFAPWPDRVVASNPPRQLAQWKGRFLAGGCVIDPEDTVRGVCYLHLRSGIQQSVECITWTFDAKSQFAETARRTLAWTSTAPIDTASARVRPDGTPAALIRDQGSGRWFVDTGYEDIKPLQLNPVQGRLPLELAFGGPTRDPILICASQGGGLSMKQLDGTDLPEHC